MPISGRAALLEPVSSAGAGVPCANPTVKHQAAQSSSAFAGGIVMAYEFESEVTQHELEDEFSGESEGEFESSLEGEGWLGTISNVVGNLLGEGEEESSYESAFESALESQEGEVNPIRKIYPDAMMEHLGELAADAE